MTRADWRIVWRIALVAPFLNPAGILGWLYALFGVAVGIVSGVPEIMLFILPIALFMTLVIGTAPSFLGGYILVRGMRRQLEQGTTFTRKQTILRGARIGLILGLVMSCPAVVFLLDHQPDLMIMTAAAVVAVGGPFSGAVSGWIAHRRLVMKGLLDASTHD